MKQINKMQSLSLQKIVPIHVAILLSCVLSLGLFSQPSMASDDKAFELTILHTNDFHARFRPISKYDNNCSAEE